MLAGSGIGIDLLVVLSEGLRTPSIPRKNWKRGFGGRYYGIYNERGG
jgi:hypothetical protein